MRLTSSTRSKIGVPAKNIVVTTVRTTIVLLALTLGAASSARAQDDDGVRLLLGRIERVVRAGDPAAYFALLSDRADRARAGEFASSELMPGASRSVLQERDRLPLAGAAGSGYRLMVDVMAEFESRARVSTWRLDLRRTGTAGAENEWTIADQERISSVENLYRVSINGAKQYAARDLKIAAEDLDLTLTEGSVFVAEIDAGVTAAVLLGKGTVDFHPSPSTEKGQVKIFCGSDTLETRFDAAYIRLNPSDFESFFSASALTPVAVDARSL
jgi:hypothetical protein